MGFIKKILYKRAAFLVSLYHLLWAFWGALKNDFPAFGMTVVGITGTKGKTSSSNYLWHILSFAGYKTALITTVNFRIGEKEKVNPSKQTMLGRGGAQKIIAQAKKEGCSHLIVETSSEGILQHRHKFLNYKLAALTNLTPEHIERHGSFDNYKKAKRVLFEEISKNNNGIAVVNADDPSAQYFLEVPVSRRVSFGSKNSGISGVEHIPFAIKSIDADKTVFVLNGTEMEIPFAGEFFAYNAALASVCAWSLGVPWEKIAQALLSIPQVSGRFQIINEGQDYLAVVDYAHEPASLRSLYEAVNIRKPKRIIGLLGAQGGGRDKWKQMEMGKIAANYCAEVFLTNEDPYDDDPLEIMAGVEEGLFSAGFSPEKIHKIIDRREAIRGAINMAQPQDAIVFSGKGGEVWMCISGGQKIPWNEAEEVRGAIRARN